MNVFNETPPHFGDVVLARPNPSSYKFGHRNPVEYNVQYINNLRCSVTIGWRSGLKFTLPPLGDLDSNKLIVRVEIIIHQARVAEVQHLLSAVTESSSRELKVLRESFTDNVLSNTYGGAKIVVDYPLSLEELQEYGGTIYYHELDSIVSLHGIDDCPPHPYSDEGRELQVIDAKSSCLSELGFGYSVELVDNHEKYGDRYLNIGNKVYKVAPQKDFNRRDGIYIVANRPVMGRIGRHGRELKHYPFEGAEEKLGLFKTSEEALTFGDGTHARKQELAQLEHRLSVHKFELQDAKNRHTSELMEKEKELKIIEMERDRNARQISEMREASEHAMKMERERMKAYYEDRVYTRKDSNELLKILPGLVMGIGTLFMAIKTFGTGTPQK